MPHNSGGEKDPESVADYLWQWRWSSLHESTSVCPPLLISSHCPSLYWLYYLCTIHTHTSTRTLSLHYPHTHKHKNTIFALSTHTHKHKNTIFALSTHTQAQEHYLLALSTHTQAQEHYLSALFALLSLWTSTLTQSM